MLHSQATSSSSVAITGTSAIVGSRDNISSVWSAVLADEGPNFSQLPEEHLVLASGLRASDARICAPHQLLALAAIRAAWCSARLPEELNPLRGVRTRVRRPRWGIVTASSVAHLIAMNHELTNASLDISPFSLSRWRGNSIAAVASLIFGLGGLDLSLNTASASGAQAIAVGGSLVRSGALDVVVVVGADLSPVGAIREAMERTGSLDLSLTGQPLSSTRSGMQPCTGAACVILEAKEHALARGCEVSVEWVDGQCANEAYSLVAPEPSGQVMTELVGELRERTLKRTGTDAIDWVSLHATGTRKYDGTEVMALSSLLAEQRPWLSAFKRSTGHSMGAAGILDIALLAHGITLQQLPPWPTDTDPSLGLEDFRPTQQPRPTRVLACSQGMGGAVVVNYLQRI